MISVQVEDWFAVKGEAQALWDLHFAEIGQGRHTGWKLEPDLDLVGILARAGKFHIVTVREDGRLAGYHASIVEPLLHYKSILAAKSDLYWLAPECRVGRVALRLFQEVERSLRARGVKVLYDGTKVELDRGELFEHLGYQLIEKRYCKVLED